MHMVEGARYGADVRAMPVLNHGVINQSVEYATANVHIVTNASAWSGWSQNNYKHSLLNDVYIRRK